MSFKKVLSVVNGEVIHQDDNKTGITPSVSIADAEIFDTGIDAFVGNLSVKTEEDGVVALCSIASGVQVIESVTGSAEFSDTKATATKVNVYVEGGTIRVQNLTGDAISLEARLY